MCGYTVFARDPREAKRNFNAKFFRKGISWDGYVVRVNFNEENPMSMQYHSATILVKMDEDDRIGVHGPDIGLSISELRLSQMTEVIGSLHRGDHIRFNATLQAMGDASHLHHLSAFGIERLEGHRDVEAHAYSNGRYKLRIEPHDGKDHSHDEESTESIVFDVDKHSDTTPVRSPSSTSSTSS